MAQLVVFCLKRGSVQRRCNKSVVFRSGAVGTVCCYCGRCFHCRRSFSMYGFLLHGILETLGAMAGDAVGLICLLGYTTLPFLVMTPVALLGTKLGLPGMLVVVGAACITAKLWMLYLLIRALQVVYLIDFKRSLATVAFSLLLLYIAFVLPLQIVFELLMLKIS